MDTEEKKALARRFYKEPLEERRSSSFDELVSDDYIDADAESAEERVPGPDGVRRLNDRFLDAFTDIRVTIKDQIAEGDKVVTRWSAEGTHSGDFMGIPATGKRVRTSGIAIHLIRGGRIAAEWGKMDQLQLLTELGGVQLRHGS